MASAGNKRTLTEIGRLQALGNNTDPSSIKFVLEKSPIDNQGSNIILGRIFPKSPIFNQASFQVELKLPPEYPFRAPEARFITPIYHPNVNEEGKICIEKLAEAYKPVTSLVDIIKDITDRIDNPDIEHALNAGNVLCIF